MARIRSIHPGLFTDEAFVTLTSDAQVFFLGLLTEADDQGIFEWKPLTLKIRLRGGKDGPVEPLLEELHTVNNVRKFELAGRHYGAIRNFRRFQRPKKPNRVHPINDEIRTYVGLNAPSSEMDDDEDGSGTELSPQMEEEGGRREDGGGSQITSGVASPSPPATVDPTAPEFIRLPTNKFETAGEEVIITEQFIEQYQPLYPAVDVRSELRKMRGWLLSRPDQRKTKKGMTRFAVAWFGRQQDKPASRETAYGGHDGKPASNGSFGSSVSRAVDARNSGGLFDQGGPGDRGHADESTSGGTVIEGNLVGHRDHAA